MGGLNALSHLGLSIHDIDQIVLTHHHTDHTGLLNRVLDRHPIPVYAPQTDGRSIDKTRHFSPMTTKRTS